MPEKDCNIPLTFKSYLRTKPVRLFGKVKKSPKLAPKHQKPDATILAELTKKIDDQIATRNGIVPPSCPPCDYLGTKRVQSFITRRVAHLIWTENFSLRDADGNVITGTATYMAKGDTRVETVIYAVYCDKPFGDDPKGFEKAAWDPEMTNLEMVPYDLGKYWKLLPDDYKLDLEYKEKPK